MMSQVCLIAIELAMGLVNITSPSPTTLVCLAQSYHHQMPRLQPHETNKLVYKTCAHSTSVCVILLGDFQ